MRRLGDVADSPCGRSPSRGSSRTSSASCSPASRSSSASRSCRARSCSPRRSSRRSTTSSPTSTSDTDAVVRAPQSVQERLRRRPAAASAPTSLPDGAQAPTAWPRPRARCRAYAQIVDKNGKALGEQRPGRADARLRLEPQPRSEPVPPRRRARRPTAADEIVIDKNSADDGGFKVGDTVHGAHARRAAPKYDARRHRRSSATPTASPARRSRCSRCARRSVLADAAAQFDAIDVVGRTRASRRTRSCATSATALRADPAAASTR